jgi:hypothetical protein
MKPSFLSLTITFLFFGFVATAQSGLIKGTIVDTAVKKPLASATISVVQATDSSLVSFARSNDQGSFSVTRLDAGNYILMVSFTGFDTYFKNFAVTEATKEIDAGIIPMTSQNTGMNVTVTAAPIVIKGDTVEYNAGSFKTKTNASVEDLLKKLPGVVIDKDGGITANGKTITKVMVDGKEFFTNDPKLATKNLQADMINKVQVYEKKSDKSDFTGFDDGNTEPTINLTLKADKRVGIFGRASGGYGTRDRYDASTNVNSFKKGEQLSLIAQSNNINKQGFSLMDALSFSGGGSGGSAGGNLRTIGSGNGLNVAGFGGSGQGITNTNAVGLNYNNFKSKNLDLNSSYFFNNTHLLKEYVTRREYLRGNSSDSSQIYNEPGATTRDNNNHRFNLSVDWRMDSSNSIKITPSFTYQTTNTNSHYDFSTLSSKGLRLSAGTNTTNTNNEGYNAGVTALYRHRFAKKGRTFTTQLSGSRNESDAKGDQFAITPRNTPNGAVYYYDTINRINTTDAVSTNFGVNVSYTEPVSRRSLIELNAYHNHNGSISDRKAFDYNKATGRYDRINQSLTNYFDNSYDYSGAGINYRENRKLWNYMVGLNFQRSELQSLIQGKNQAVTQTFFNVLPTAMLQIRPNSYKNFRLNYNGTTRQPSVAQLQPIRDSTDPLNVIQGNPNLKQEFTNNVRINYNVFDPYTQKNFFLFINGSQTFNKIVNDDSIGGVGNRLTRYANVNGTYSANVTGSYGFPVTIAGIKANLNLSTTANYNHNINLLFIRDKLKSEENKINTLTLTERPSLNYTYKELFDVSINAGITWYNTTYSLQKAQNNNYFSHSYGFNTNFYLPAGFTIENDIDYTLNTGRAAGFNPKILLWNANITKSVFKNKKGEIKLNVYDLLNQNKGVIRNPNGNYIEDQTYNVLKRYVMLSFTYNLSKFGASNPAAPGGMRQMIRTMGGGRMGM